MSTISNERLIATKVLVMFEDSPVSFRVPSGATLADVSEKVEKIGRWYKGQALSIDARFGTARDYAGLPLSPLISQLGAAGYGPYRFGSRFRDCCSTSAPASA